MQSIQRTNGQKSGNMRYEIERCIHSKPIIQVKANCMKESNAFIVAADAARDAGKKVFEYDGKMFNTRLR